MKYPITPEYLKTAPDPIVDLYLSLEETVIKDICRRFRLSGTATNSAVEQIKLLKRKGYSQEEIENAIAKTLNMSRVELDKLFGEAVDRNKQYYGGVFDKVQLLDADVDMLATQSEIDAVYAQTAGEFKNITRSLGFAIRDQGEIKFLPIADIYQKILDDAELEVWSGAVDYNTAVKDAVKRLADSGLQTMVDYASGWHNRVDVAARRAIMTGVTQISRQYSESAAERLETPYREVTAHVGARDKPGPSPWSSHKEWQGKVYSVNEGDKYPSIYRVCGLGFVDGLTGANCRHLYYPFIDGVSERTWTDEQLENIDPPPFEYQGKEYTAYEATQKQRQIETAIRQTKRECLAYESAGLEVDYTDASVKLRRLREEYKAFSKAAGLRTQPERLNVLNFGRSNSAKATGRAEEYHSYWLKNIGAEKTELKTLAKYYDGKYNNSPQYRLLEIYARDVDSGWISPNASFARYVEAYNDIQNNIVGKITSNGILITGQRDHFMQRVLGTGRDPKKYKDDHRIIRRSGVEIEDIKSALFSPVDIGKVKTRGDGKRSVKLYGHKCAVSINPDTGELIQVNPLEE